MPEPLRVLITGATSGLGRAMAVELARRGARVAVTGRRGPKLLETAAAVAQAGGECLPLLGSVTDLAEVKSQYAQIRTRWGGLDWAILNAAVNDSMDAREFKAENYRWTFETNIGGAANWMEAVIPDMVARGRGIVAGISSLAGYRGLPRSGAYGASKAAFITMLESARLDLQGTGVSVVTVCPGYVKSEMTARNDPRDMIFLLETDDGARRIIAGIEAKKRLVHFPWPLSLFTVYLLPNLPSFIFDWLAPKVVKRRKKPYVDESNPPAGGK